MADTLINAVATPLISSAVSSIFGGTQNNNGTAAAAAADPFSSQRGQYQTQLSELMSNPNSFQMSATAQAAEKQGLDATSATMAARGLSSSGAEKAALTQYATSAENTAYQQEISNLMTLSGANTGSPGTAGQLVASGSASSNQALGTISNSIGSAITASNPFATFSNWLSGSSAAAGSTAAADAGSAAGATDLIDTAATLA